MRPRQLGALVITLGLLAGCGGGSPSAPSTATTPPATGVSPAATQGIIGATLTQANSLVITAQSGIGFSNVLTSNCPGGGTMTMAFTATPPSSPGSTITTTSRTEFSDCRSQNVTINGDPYLTMTGEHTVTTGANSLPTNITATTRMTGGLRFDAGGVQGRAQYDCTQTMSMQVILDGPVSQPTFTTVISIGTITWEQPLGTVTTRACGP